MSTEPYIERREDGSHLNVWECIKAFGVQKELPKATDFECMCDAPEETNEPEETPLVKTKTIKEFRLEDLT